MRPSLTLSRALTRRIGSLHHLPRPKSNPCPRITVPILSQTPRRRHLSSTKPTSKGLTPDSSDPEPPKPQSSSTLTDAQPAEISESEYHEMADQYFDSLLLALEEKAETESDLEVEYSAGVLTVARGENTYVMNKQPPNKQIWLSSPLSGPKRYDYVVAGASQHEKEESDIEGQGGQWVYLRDGSLLSDLLEKELGVVVTKNKEAGDVTPDKEGPGGSGS